MTQKRLRFALFGKEYPTGREAGIGKVLQSLHDKGAEIWTDRPFADFIAQEGLAGGIAFNRFEGTDFEADYAISIGGDGTFLKAAGRVAAKQIPLFGVNMGRLGFLADVLPAEIDATLEAVYSGAVELARHSMIQVTSEGEPIAEYPYALNDIAVLKRDSASMISIRTEVNGEYLATYQADGLIVSTPTGSTAYSLSNGGPIIVPQTGTVCLTPVAPHSLNIRPIVLPDNVVVRLSVESRSHNFLVAIDGRSEKLAQGTSLVVRKAPFCTQIVKHGGKQYFSTLREKMMWGQTALR
ncbi:MAG: NAD kinase [Prevotella sp.]|nr:NAD kinase [Prevotella sp.]